MGQGIRHTMAHKQKAVKWVEDYMLTNKCSSKVAQENVEVTEAQYYRWRREIAEHATPDKHRMSRKAKPYQRAAPKSVQAQHIVYSAKVREAIDQCVNIFINDLDRELEQAMQDAVKKLAEKYK